MNIYKKILYAFLIFLSMFGFSAFAADKVDVHNLILAPAASPQMEGIRHIFHGFMIPITLAIVALVFLLLLIVIFRFSEKRNPVPSTTSHNTWIEIIWTAVPIVLLIVIAVPSLKYIKNFQGHVQADMNVKVTGYQWYWGYEYLDHGNLEFSATMIRDKAALKDRPYLLATDNPVVLPVGKKIRFLVTAADVIHSFTVPEFGIKMDAIPGRMNEMWTEISKPGVYYGQCSELCGKDHAYMPIMIYAVEQDVFDRWIVAAKAAKAAGKTLPLPSEVLAVGSDIVPAAVQEIKKK